MKIGRAISRTLYLDEENCTRHDGILANRTALELGWQPAARMRQTEERKRERERERERERVQGCDEKSETGSGQRSGGNEPQERSSDREEVRERK